MPFLTLVGDAVDSIQDFMYVDDMLSTHELWCALPFSSYIFHLLLLLTCEICPLPGCSNSSLVWYIQAVVNLWTTDIWVANVVDWSDHSRLGLMYPKSKGVCACFQSLNQMNLSCWQCQQDTWRGRSNHRIEGRVGVSSCGMLLIHTTWWHLYSTTNSSCYDLIMFSFI